MKKIKKLIFSVLLAFWLAVSFFNPTTVAAEDKNFESSLETTYTVSTDGSTFVQHKFKIENLSPSFYISKHGLRTSSPNITAIKVFDKNGDIKFEETQVGNQTNIGITFPDKLVGEGKIRDFTISYRNKDVAQVNGRVLEVTIPKQANPDQYNSYSVILNTPAQFGNPSRVAPSDNFSLNHEGTFINLRFDNLAGRGVTAIYGTEQIFNLDFKYFLENNESQPVLLQVAMPPDTSFQRLHYHQIEPTPEKIVIDEDGNWIATFYMDGNTAKTIEVKAQALITLNPNLNIPVYEPQSFHTRPQTYWETNSSAIRKLADENNSPEEIYDFVTTNLTYNVIGSLDDFERLGASKSLETPKQAACQEFTDLFVTLNRANNTPTRAITGYAYTENSDLRPLSLIEDILHAWPEHWNEEKQLWIPTDPTWGNTTGGVDYFNQFDLNHIVLAINGKSSTLPYPAGAYKTDEQKGKTLEVDFGLIFPELEPAVETKLEKRQEQGLMEKLALPGFYNLTITNPTGQAWYNLNFDLLAEHSKVNIQAPQKNISALLPYQSVEIPVFVYNTEGVLPKTDTLTVQVKMDELQPGNQIELVNQNVEITNAPRYLQLISHPQTRFALGIGIIFVTLLSGSVLILRQKR